MKKILTLMLTLCMVFALSACSGAMGESSGDASISESSRPDGQRLPSNFSAPAADTDPVEAAMTLLAQDASIIDIFFSHSIDATYGDIVEGTADNGYYVLEDPVTFESYTDLERLIRATYANEEDVEYYLHWPNEEKPLYKGDNKTLLIHCADAIGFRPAVDFDTVELVEATDKKVTFRFTYYEPDYWLDPGTDLPTPNNIMTMSLTDENTWKLDDTFYHYYQSVNINPYPAQTN